jgi:hypothetical protein
MTMKYTQTTLDKIEKILDEVGYIVRYERGNFQSGYCILEQRKVVVLNKFLPLEGRISTLIDIIPQLKITPETLSPDVPEARRIYEDSCSLPALFRNFIREPSANPNYLPGHRHQHRRSHGSLSL